MRTLYKTLKRASLIRQLTTNLPLVHFRSELRRRPFQDGDRLPETERDAHARVQYHGRRYDVHREKQEEEKSRAEASHRCRCTGEEEAIDFVEAVRTGGARHEAEVAVDAERVALAVEEGKGDEQ